MLARPGSRAVIDTHNSREQVPAAWSYWPVELNENGVPLMAKAAFAAIFLDRNSFPPAQRLQQGLSNAAAFACNCYALEYVKTQKLKFWIDTFKVAPDVHSIAILTVYFVRHVTHDFIFT